MKFRIDRKVFETFPTLVVSIPVIMELDNTQGKKEALEFLRVTEKDIREKLNLDSFWKDPRVTAYLECFKKFGIDPQKFLPAHIALSKRVLEGGALPDINPLVNIYNSLSIKYLTPFGGEDLDALYGDFTLKFAQGGEQWIPIGGGKSKPAVKGELVWLDNFDLSTRALNWRQCERTKITDTTKNGYFIMDGFEDVNRNNITIAAKEFIKVATKLFGGKGEIYWLDSIHHELDVPFKTKTFSQKESHLSKKEGKKGTQKSPVKSKTELSQIAQLLSKNQPLIISQLQNIIAKALDDALGYKTSSLYEIKIEHPKVENYGDFATNIALVLGNKLKMKPFDVAEKLDRKLKEYIRDGQTISIKTDSKAVSPVIYSVSDILEKSQAVLPGFLNLFLSQKYLSTHLSILLSSDYPVSTGKTQQLSSTSKDSISRVLVEFAHPNTLKEFHIGHLRNISIGESVVRILEANGVKVFRANYEGDVGLHVAKALWGVYQKLGENKDKKTALDEITAVMTPAQKAKFLGEGYALGSKKYDDDKSVTSEIIALNKAIFNDPDAVLFWKETRQMSLDYFDSIYKRLGSHFDRLFFESEVEERGREIVKQNIKTGLFIQDKDGSIYFPGQKYGLNNCVFVTQENYATYEGKEIACEELEYKTFPYELSVNVVAIEQRNFFQISYKATETVFPIHRGKHFHLAYGMVNLKSGKLSSRKGEVITADWLIDEAKKRVREIIASTDKKGVEAIPDAAIEKIAVAAVKYSMLRVNPLMNIAFDIEKSVSFDGDSGPYLQYTYARCKSVIRKWEAGSGKLEKEVGSEKSKGPTSHVNNLASHLPPLTSWNPEELALLRTFVRFEEVVYEAAKSFSPNLICSYLFDLAQKYNLFYAKHSILGIIEYKTNNPSTTLMAGIKQEKEPNTHNLQPTTQFRLALTQATANILKSGLNLLGIETVERM